MSRDEHEAQGSGRLGVRDMDRIREKVSVSLEPRQLGFIGLGLTVVMAAVFALGMLVGDRGGTTGLVSNPEIAGAPVSGSFPAELPVMRPRARPVMDLSSRPTRLIRKAVILPVPSPRPLAVARSADDGPPALALRRGTVRIPDSVFAQDDMPWPSVAVTDLAMCMSCVYEDLGGCVPPVLPPAKPDKARQPLKSKPAMAVTKASQVKAIKEKAIKEKAVKKKTIAVARAKVLKKKTATRVPAKVTTQPPQAFAVQVRAYRESAKAAEFVNALVLKGYKPFIVKYTDAQGHKWFRVRMGRFDNAVKAQEFAAEFNAKEAAEAIPVALE
ncbi:MAG: hypothetical protein GXP54_09535 [Deltaproteobacteria bacterium]|nr:hypothetical protein [Deltaproteobacteria bacterium]